MTTLSASQLKKVKRVSWIVSALALLTALSSAIITLFVCSMVISELVSKEPFLPFFIEKAFSLFQIDYLNLSASEKLTVLTSLLVMLLLSTFFCYYLHRLFKAFRQQGIFSQPATRSARILAWLFSGSFLFDQLIGWLIPFPTHSELLQLLANNSTLDDLTLIGILWVSVWVLEYGQALQIENEMTI